MVFNSLNIAQKDKVSSETQDSLLTMTYKIKIWLTYFQYATVQSKHFHFKRKEFVNERTKAMPKPTEQKLNPATGIRDL